MEAHFTLVSWNILQGLHHRSKRYRRVQNAAITDHLATLDADVLILPEAWEFGRAHSTWTEDLAAELGYELHQWAADRPSRSREVAPWRMVILTRIPARTLAPRLMPAYPGLGPRGAVRVELERSGVTIAGVHLYGIHLLRYRLGRSWLHERAELRALAAEHDIVAGDMNMWGPIVRRDARDLRPAVRGRTYPAPHPHSQIDHVLVSKRMRVASSEVLPDMGSDHHGLRVELVVDD